MDGGRSSRGSREARGQIPELKGSGIRPRRSSDSSPLDGVLDLQRDAGNRAVIQLLAQSDPGAPVVQRQAIPDRILLTGREILRRIPSLESECADAHSMDDGAIIGAAGAIRRLLGSPHLADAGEPALERLRRLTVALRAEVIRRQRPVGGAPALSEGPSISAGSGGGRALSDAEIAAAQGPGPAGERLREIAQFGPLASVAFIVSYTTSGDFDQAFRAGEAGALADASIEAVGTARTPMEHPGPTTDREERPAGVVARKMLDSSAGGSDAARPGEPSSFSIGDH